MILKPDLNPSSQIEFTQDIIKNSSLTENNNVIENIENTGDEAKEVNILIDDITSGIDYNVNDKIIGEHKEYVDSIHENIDLNLEARIIDSETYYN